MNVHGYAADPDVAALIELAGMLGKEGLPIRFVAFVNERPRRPRPRPQGHRRLQEERRLSIRRRRRALASDTPEKLDYERLARVTLGLAAVLRELTTEER